MKKLTVIDKFKVLAREATPEERRIFRIVLDVIEPATEPRKKAEPAKMRKSRLSPADSAAMQQDAQREG